MTIKIPGLIEAKKNLGLKTTKEDLEMEEAYMKNKMEANRIKQSKGLYEQMMNPNQTYLGDANLNPGNSSSSNTQYTLGTDPYWGINQPPQTLPYNHNQFYDQDIWGKKTRIPTNDPVDLDELKKLVFGVSDSKTKTKSKSALEEILDELFSQADKEQFLIDVGYMLETKDEQTGIIFLPDHIIIKRKLADGTVKRITTPFSLLFLKEITVKFRNLLLAKASLKLKLPKIEDAIQDKENQERESI